ncbi:FAD-dependent oxidoreductase [Rhodoferax saidenbachensis]|uniref:NAD/FAD-dependent oxidoreductase n=1 Tax=Rhodoferax saidenbachensis TaxID=1484693 RepID=A0ABU1ZH94_9BURK|nr:FAD-dependent oxidoreductase [Rhodoferax saidenbachensis]MDR7304902.1 putative NAD/FAD-dependent oxidoreductase [Rhodoferax saidenbachensis]
MTTSQHIAIVGAGMAGIACARTLVQAGHRVTVFDKSQGLGGRMSTRSSDFGTFDHGAQYFTVRDARFELALQTTPGLCRPWSANTVRVLDSHGRVAAAGLPARESHWVPTPGMNALVSAWAKPLTVAGSVELQAKVTAIEPDALHKNQWQLRTTGADDSSHVYSGFDAVVLAIPHPQAQALLSSTPKGVALAKKTAKVSVAPCWTLMLAYPQAVQPGLTTLGPQWNAARSTHHRIAWLARESSKPGRGRVERWTVQASAAWSQEHLLDDAPRVQAKLIKAFSEITGIRAEPAHVDVHRWMYAKTEKALGQSHLWDAKAGLGVCGDWCIGHRVEDAFVSGLELALSMA